ncbi:hypothetical protein Glove_372g9 [Diversispora epigaea]|uniref:Uncharacterized protein n=1 Tax=Diversispora epigaea TaxID=1348612 RepID=A0A397HAP8_9GLOM|nr:hypothetical protein Glove_372g9 [Diversispora epigaea]
MIEDVHLHNVKRIYRINVLFIKVILEKTYLKIHNREKTIKYKFNILSFLTKHVRTCNKNQIKLHDIRSNIEDYNLIFLGVIWCEWEDMDI